VRLYIYSLTPIDGEARKRRELSPQVKGYAWPVRCK